MTDIPPQASPIPEIGRVTLMEILACLKRGIDDFRRAPLYGLMFSTFYVGVGFVLLILGAGAFTWTLTLSLGFPLVAPFAAVGLYEVSRRLEAGIPLKRNEILSVVVAEKDRQLPWMGAILLIIFLFWSFFAHMLFALMLGVSNLGNIAHSIEAITTTREGLTMAAVQITVGGAVAFLTFSLTVVSLPLLLEKELDFVTAMMVSLRTVRANLFPMLVWAAIVAGLMILGMLPVFLGLYVVLPVLGHATWHLYRRALYHPV